MGPRQRIPKPQEIKIYTYIYIFLMSLRHVEEIHIKIVQPAENISSSNNKHMKQHFASIKNK